MSKIAAWSKIASGTCVIIASVFSSGCATSTVAPMPVRDLANFQIDCRIKSQQIAFLEGMRSRGDDRLVSKLSTGAIWKYYTDPLQYQQYQQMATGRSDWMINQLLMRIQWDCP